MGIDSFAREDWCGRSISTYTVFGDLWQSTSGVLALPPPWNPVTTLSPSQLASVLKNPISFLKKKVDCPIILIQKVYIR